MEGLAIFENLDDPKKQALLALAAGLLSPVRGKGWSGFGEAMGQGINSGLLGLNAANRTQEAMKRGEMERKLEAARLAEYERAQNTNNPPAGAWYRSDGLDRVIGATHRSVGGAIGALFVCLFWNGIVSVFVLTTLGSTLRHLGISLPHWFPAPEMDGGPMGVGMTIFLWIFLTPFIVVGLAMAGAFLSCVGGRTEVRIQNTEGRVFSGIGPFGLRRRFDTSTVKEVRVEERHWRDSDGDRRHKAHIIIEPLQAKTIRFGSMLTEERRRFVAAAVRSALTS